MKILHLRTKWIYFLYRVATGSKKFRNLLTPIGATLYILFTAVFVIAALQLDTVLYFPKFITEPINIILAVPIVIFGACISLWSAFHFLKVKGTPVPVNPPPKLVTSGPFAYARNPMVTGIFIILFGLGILYSSVTLILLFTPLFISINIWELKAIEEPELEKRLGEEYIEYKSRTPMFIPGLRKKTK
jgi:protein-S-isoprenylcysteine O-methyltransferase Ste14